MESILEFLQTVNWRIVGEVVVALLAVIIAIKKGKTSRGLKAAVKLLQTVYSAVEESGAAPAAKTIKSEVKKAVAEMAPKIPDLKEIEAAVMSTVDPKKVDNEVPAIKRCWRRFLKGENLGGVAARIILKN